MRAHEAGFSALEVAFAVVVMGVAGGSGYYVYQQQNDEKPLATEQRQTAEPAAKVSSCGKLEGNIEATAVVFANKSLSTCVPNGWRLQGSPDGQLIIGNAQDLMYDATKPATATFDLPGSDSFKPFAITVRNAQTKTDTTGYQNVTPAGIDGPTEYFYHLTGKNDSIGAGIDMLPEGAKQYLYVTTFTDGTVVEVDYVQLSDAPDLREYAEIVGVTLEQPK